MAFKSYRDHSRINYGTDIDGANLEQINTGSLLRIADATELMSKNYIHLQNERDSLIRRLDYSTERITKLENRIRGLKGAITRLKKVTKKSR